MLLAEFTYNSIESKGIGVTLFYTNIRYTLIVYREEQLLTIVVEAIRVQSIELKELHKELAIDIQFIYTRLVFFYN